MTYAERIKAEPAAASAKRKAEKAEYPGSLSWSAKSGAGADQLKEEIKSRGDKVQLDSRGSLQAMADESISPFLKARQPKRMSAGA